MKSASRRVRTEFVNRTWGCAAVEYGMIGTPESPNLYGAGLLSSIGESTWCMTDEVKKLPYSIDAAYQEFDITKPQPQLFVTPDFAYLMQVLEEFAGTMAVRKGGWRGLKKLIGSKQIGTLELNTGLQVSGIFTKMIQNEDNEVVYFATEGETALSYREKELIGHGTARYKNGFSSPLGKLKGINLSIENMGPRDLKAYDFYDGKPISFEYESGITVSGMNVTGMRNLGGQLMLIQFTDCTVSYNSEILHSPENGDFDLVIGSEIVSAFAGAADFLSFDLVNHVSETNTFKPSLSEAEDKLNTLYQQVRLQRENNETDEIELLEIFQTLKKEYPNDWLCVLEIFELTRNNVVLDYLKQLQTTKTDIAHLIENGFEILA